MPSAIIVADLNGRIFQWLDRFGPLLTRSGGKPRRWPPTAFPKRTLRACSASRSQPCASIAVPSSTRVPPGPTRRSLTFLFYGICGGTGKPAFKDERARVTAAIFWMKTRGGWSETSTHKHTGVANGDPIEVEVGTVRERLMRRIARIAAAGTTGGVPETDE